MRSPGFPANICSAAHGFVSQARCVRVFRPCPNHGLALERFLGFPVSTVLPSFMYRRGRIPGSRVGLVSRETQKFPRVLGPGKEAATVRSWLPWDGSRRTIGYVDVLSSIDRRILLQRLFVETVGSFLLCRSLVSCWCTIHHCLVGSRKDPWSPSIYFDPRATCFHSVSDVFVLRLDVRRSRFSPFSIGWDSPSCLGRCLPNGTNPVGLFSRTHRGMGRYRTTTPSTGFTDRFMGAFPRIAWVVLSILFFLFRLSLDWFCVDYLPVQVIPCVRGEKQLCACSILFPSTLRSWVDRSPLPPLPSRCTPFADTPALEGQEPGEFSLLRPPPPSRCGMGCNWGAGEGCGFGVRGRVASVADDSPQQTHRSSPHVFVEQTSEPNEGRTRGRDVVCVVGGSRGGGAKQTETVHEESKNEPFDRCSSGRRIQDVLGRKAKENERKKKKEPVVRAVEDEETKRRTSPSKGTIVRKETTRKMRLRSAARVEAKGWDREWKETAQDNDLAMEKQRIKQWKEQCRTPDRNNQQTSRTDQERNEQEAKTPVLKNVQVRRNEQTEHGDETKRRSDRCRGAWDETGGRT